MRKNMRKLTMAAAVSAISITALCPATAQAKGDTLTVAIWDNGQKAGLEKNYGGFHGSDRNQDRASGS